MKAAQSLLVSALFFAFAATAFAAPTAEPAVTGSLPAVEASAEAPSDVFGSSVLSGGDCGSQPAVRTVSGGDPYSVCGQCSHNPCKGAALGDYCGQVGTTAKFCLDYFGGALCLQEDGVHCRCVSEIP